MTARVVWHSDLPGMRGALRWAALLAFVALGAVARPAEPATADGAEGDAVAPGWARLKLSDSNYRDDNWDVAPGNDLALLAFIRSNTTANPGRERFVADAAKIEELVTYPFIFLHASGEAGLTERERANLREYLLRGGFLYVEDCVADRQGMDHDRFFLDMQEELGRLVPGAKLEQLPDEHAIFRAVFPFADGVPHYHGVPHGLWALTLDGRVLAVLSASDLHCDWKHGDKWYGLGARLATLKMATNIYVFAMTQTASATEAKLQRAKPPNATTGGSAKR